MTPRLSTLAAAAAFVCMLPAAHAGITTTTGSTSGGPTFTRAVEDFSAISAIGTAVSYAAWTFTVNVAGEYSFLTTAGFDAVTFLYSAPFVPGAPLANGLAGNDDLVSTGTSGFSVLLNTGMSYVHVVTGFGNTDAGAYSVTIGGPGIASAVPEPAAWLLAACGLAAMGGALRRRSCSPDTV